MLIFPILSYRVDETKEDKAMLNAITQPREKLHKQKFVQVSRQRMKGTLHYPELFWKLKWIPELYAEERLVSSKGKHA